VGKVIDLFAEKGFDESHRTKNNAGGIEGLLRLLEKPVSEPTFVFTNLIDTDQLFGHRLDPQGYAGSLKEFDEALPLLMQAVGPDDLIIITGDHGNDPCSDSTDHSREFVPVLLYTGENTFKPGNLGIRESLSDVAVTVSEFFELPSPFSGLSMLSVGI
jgi:phosphopentomutase